jgi:acyl-CoA synthetase (AMP-forming)/AMP-acid ligase II/acyl carrier protein
MSQISGVKTLVELLNRRASANTDETAYVFLNVGGEADTAITYGELDARARMIGTHLQAGQARVGEPVLLPIQPGIDYICAFFGCLYAGAIPVPAYPPASARHLSRLQSILNDAQATIACTTSIDMQRFAAMEGEATQNRPEKLPIVEWVLVDAIPDNSSMWRDPGLTETSLAFLQYTSGSTSAPKGVMVSQRNLLDNVELIGNRIQTRNGDVGVCWLPPYHDFGLIGGILFAAFWGQMTVLMRPASFLLNPYRWLKAITDYQGSITGAPNFAYDLCARKITPEQRATLDLRRLRAAFSGGEPIRDVTLRSFSQAFASCGFRPEAWLPAYGLAESTLMVSGRLQREASPESVARSLVLSKALLAQNKVEVTAVDDGVSLVSLGPALPGHDVAIVDPVTCQQCPPDEPGEIWVKGPCVAQGYWNRPEQSDATFRAMIAPLDRGPYMRTGDLGFLHKGEVYISGRLKDLIIINGRNVFPQDVENASFESEPRLRTDGAAAFSLSQGPTEKLVVAQELEFRAAADEALFGAIGASVLVQVDVPPDVILLLKPGHLPRTSSGKIQRQLCKKRFLEGSLEFVARWDRPDVDSVAPTRPRTVLPTLTASFFAAHLSAQLARRLNLEVDAIDSEQPFAFYGLDSQTTVQMGAELESWLQRPISPTLFWDFPTIAKLSQHLASAHRGAPYQRATTGLPANSDEAIALAGTGSRLPAVGGGAR